MKTAGILVLAVLVATGVYYSSSLFYTKYKAQSVPNIPEISTFGWKEYVDVKEGYSFLYPSDWEIEGGSLKLPGTLAAREECRIKYPNDPCGPTQVGSEFFRIVVSPQEGYDEQLYQHLKMNQISTKKTTLNNWPATFYIDPSITEHYYWDIYQRNKVYSISVITQKAAVDESGITDKNLALKFQQTALAIANTFTLIN